MPKHTSQSFVFKNILRLYFLKLALILPTHLTYPHTVYDFLTVFRIFTFNFLTHPLASLHNNF